MIQLYNFIAQVTPQFIIHHYELYIYFASTRITIFLEIFHQSWYVKIKQTHPFQHTL